MFQIVSGWGPTIPLHINKLGMAKTLAITQGIAYYVNRQKHFYSCPIQVTPTGAGDCFFYLKNIGDTDIVIQRLSAHVPTNEVINCYMRDIGDPVDGTDFTPINRNCGASGDVEAEVQYGVNITGLTPGDNVDNFHIAADDYTHTYRWEAGIMIPKNKVFTLYAQVGAIEIDFTLTFFCCAGL